MSFWKRLKQPSSLAGFALLANIIPSILGIGGDIGGQVGAGLEVATQGVGQGMPLWQALLVGVLAGGAVIRDDKSDAPSVGAVK